MPIVFIPHKQDESYSFDKAKEFGPTKILFDGRINIYEQGFAEAVIDKLQDFKKEDFLVLTGNRAVLCIAMANIIERYGDVRLLAFSNRNNKFTEYKLKG